MTSHNDPGHSSGNLENIGNSQLCIRRFSFHERLISPARTRLKINILGCHGSDLYVRSGEGGLHCRSVGFLINDQVMLDAGTGAFELDWDRQQRLMHIVCSHVHLDHVQALPALADNRAGTPGDPLTVASIEPVLAELKTHIFNGRVFPELFSLPTPAAPSLQELTLVEEQQVSLSGLEFTPISVNHTVPTVGYVVRDDHASWVFSGDTHHTERLWDVAKQTPNLKGAFIEASFPDEMHDFAALTKHLTPSLLMQEFKKLERPELPVFAYHLKPRFRDRVAQQLSKLGIRHLHVLQEGEEINL
jgi:ribonuclease BN (tRNA processing enzyme)